MSRLRLNKIVTPAAPAANKGELFYSSTLSPAAPAWSDENSVISRIGGMYVNGSTATPGAGFAADTYLAGSAINIGTPGAWRPQSIYICEWEAAKTAAGATAWAIALRMGTAGTTADTAIVTQTNAGQTAAIDTAFFRTIVSFRSVGSGTSAVVQMVTECRHALASTGFSTAGVTGWERLVSVSAGFNSTTPNIIGLSVNYQTLAVVTITSVQAHLMT
jgi:hypothetical protein